MTVQTQQIGQSEAKTERAMIARRVAAIERAGAASSAVGNPAGSAAMRADQLAAPHLRATAPRGAIERRVMSVRPMVIDHHAAIGHRKRIAHPPEMDLLIANGLHVATANLMAIANLMATANPMVIASPMATASPMAIGHRGTRGPIPPTVYPGETEL